MLLARPATFIALALLGLASAQTTPSFAQESGENQSAEWVAQHGPHGNCPVTLPSDASFVPPYPVPAGSAAHFGLGAKGRFGTEKLWTVLPIDGIWRGAVPGCRFFARPPFPGVPPCHKTQIIETKMLRLCESRTGDSVGRVTKSRLTSGKPVQTCHGLPVGDKGKKLLPVIAVFQRLKHCQRIFEDAVLPCRALGAPCRFP
jgi:hypothetical protein